MVQVRVLVLKLYRNGDMVFIKNEDTMMTSTIKKPAEEEKKTTGSGGFFASGKVAPKKDTDMQIDTSSSKPSAAPEKEEDKPNPRCTHGPKGKCINCLGYKYVPNADTSKEENKDGSKMETDTPAAPPRNKCTHGPNGKCLNCADAGFIQNAKHKSFEHYMLDMKAKCKGKHQPDHKCPNCMPP